MVSWHFVNRSWTSSRSFSSVLRQCPGLWNVTDMFWKLALFNLYACLCVSLCSPRCVWIDSARTSVCLVCIHAQGSAVDGGWVQQSTLPILQCSAQSTYRMSLLHIPLSCFPVGTVLIEQSRLLRLPNIQALTHSPTYWSGMCPECEMNCMVTITMLRNQSSWLLKGSIN